MSARILIDSNVLLDVLTEDEHWFEWSSSKLEKLVESHILVINPMIYAEVSVGYKKIEEVEAALSAEIFHRENIPWEAAFLAGKIFLQYRKNNGNKRSPLTDLFIGAHATITGMKLLTRDNNRYQTYFPRLSLITPYID